MAEPRFRLNEPRVVAETAGGVVIAVDLGAGTYHTIGGDSTRLWEAIVSGATSGEVADAVAATTGGSREAALAAVAGFARTLAAAGWIVERGDVPAEAQAVDLAGCGSGLLEPGFETFTDLQDLILLDPVHEVDERGWPRAELVD
jgi:Coenzyme PQQ synthesis protein D (PqqD)